MKTEQGRTAALAALRARRKENAKTKRVDNSKLPAGAPMFFYSAALWEAGISGDMIGRNPKNHDDQWLVGAAYFTENFAPLE